jgi:hypothetical protein
MGSSDKTAMPFSVRAPSIRAADERFLSAQPGMVRRHQPKESKNA